MANTVLLSALTMIALTGITLTSLKYRHDDDDGGSSSVELNLVDDENDETMTTMRLNPKFHYYNVNNHSSSTEKSFVKRSIDDRGQYSIDDKNSSLVDEMRRDKVKQVQASVHGLMGAKATMLIVNFKNTFGRFR